MRDQHDGGHDVFPLEYANLQIQKLTFCYLNTILRLQNCYCSVRSNSRAPFSISCQQFCDKQGKPRARAYAAVALRPNTITMFVISRSFSFISQLKLQPIVSSELKLSPVWSTHIITMQNTSSLVLLLCWVVWLALDTRDDEGGTQQVNRNHSWHTTHTHTLLWWAVQSHPEPSRSWVLTGFPYINPSV